MINIVYIICNMRIPHINHTIPGMIHPQSTAPHQKFQNHSNHSKVSRTPTWRLQFRSSQVEAVDVLFWAEDPWNFELLPKKITWNLKMVVSEGKISCSKDMFRFNVKLRGCINAKLLLFFWELSTQWEKWWYLRSLQKGSIRRLQVIGSRFQQKHWCLLYSWDMLR